MRGVHWGVSLLAGALLMYASGLARANQLTITPPDQDIWATSIYSYAPGGNFPGGGLADGFLRVGGWGDLYYSLLEFNLTGLPKHAAKVRLRLYNSPASGQASPTGAYLYRITQYWNWRTQGTGRDRLRLWWADRPAVVLQNPAPLPAPAVNSYYYIDITDLYNGWQDGSIPNYGLELQPSDNNNRFDIFGSSRNTNPNLRPTLLIASSELLTAFPLHNPKTGLPYTPYSAPIITVFDHSPPVSPAYPGAPYPLYACDDADATGQLIHGEVLAFTGDAGYSQYGTWGTKQGDAFCFTRKRGVYIGGHQLAYGICRHAACPFPNMMINYVGSAKSGGPYYLNYEGHPGYDYRASSDSPVYAATSGTVSYPHKAVGMNPVTFHALALAPDADPRYRIYYLHLLTYPDLLTYPGTPPVRFIPKLGCYSNANGTPIQPRVLPLPSGTHVNAGCEIALSGSAGVAAPHLHFEVQERVSATDLKQTFPKLSCRDETWPGKVSDKCVPVDPYGWSGATTDCSAKPVIGDKYACDIGIDSINLWAIRAAP